MKKISNVLFVCTQNVFRSFSAEKLLQKYLKNIKDSSINVSSAGTYAHPDNPYSYTLEELTKLKIINLKHQQTKISQDLLDKQDIIICMTKEHQVFIKENYQRNSYLYNELAYNKKIDLEDDVETSTFGSSNLENFVKNTVSKINKGVPNLYLKLKSLI